MFSEAGIIQTYRNGLGKKLVYVSEWQYPMIRHNAIDSKNRLITYIEIDERQERFLVWAFNLELTLEANAIP